MTDELKQSLRLSYWIVSLLLIMPIVIARLDNQKTIYNIIPKCPTKEQGKACIACHSSTTYYRLVGHKMPVHIPTNPIAIIVFYISIVNFGIAVIFFLYWNIKMGRTQCV